MTENNSIIAANPSRARRGFASPVTRLLGGLLGLALIAEAYFLLHDIPLLGNSPVGRFPIPPPIPPIGEIVRFIKSAHIRNPGSLFWEAAHEQETLYRRQSVLTLEGSMAEIALLDGTSIVLDENSLIELEKLPADNTFSYEKLVIRLLRGTLHKNEMRKTPLLSRKVSERAPELQLILGNSSTSLGADAEMTLSTGPEGTRLKVSQGQMSLMTPEGELPLNEGEEAWVSDERSQMPPIARKSAFNLLSPPPGGTISADQDLAVSFSWKNDPTFIDGAALDLEASMDPGFRFAVKTLRISATEPPLEQIDAKLALASSSDSTSYPVSSSVSSPKRWYWRVRSVVENGPLSETQSFWLRGKPIPALHLPRSGVTAIEGEAIEFLWGPVDGATGYELEVSSPLPTTNFSRDFAFTLASLPLGPLKWRVRARFADGKTGPWSDSYKLEIVKRGDATHALSH